MSIINVHQDLALAECKIVELRSEVEGLRAEVERLTRERDELRTVEWAGTRIACASCRSLFKPPAQVGMSVPERECASCRRAEAAESEVARLRAALAGLLGEVEYQAKATYSHRGIVDAVNVAKAALRGGEA